MTPPAPPAPSPTRPTAGSQRSPRTSSVGRATTALLFLTILCLALPAAPLSGDGPTTTPEAIPLQRDGSPPTSHFLSIPITLDPQNQPLAAYQIQLTATHGTFQVVGIENAPNLPAFPNPARYDRTTAHPNQPIDRLILADFSLAPPENLPTEPTVIATVHAYVIPPQPLTNPTPEHLTQALGLTATLTQAANPQGQPINATANLLKAHP